MINRYNHLIFISAVVFIILNITENLVQFNIGTPEKILFSITKPSKKDIIKIGIVSLLQGIFTSLFFKNLIPKNIHYLFLSLYLQKKPNHPSNQYNELLHYYLSYS